MARLSVRGKRSAAVETTPAVSLLNSLVKEGIPIRHDCGGKALCGTCRIRILAGERSLNPVGDRERTRLEAVGAGPGERLACQSHAFRDVDIEIPEDRR